MQSNNQKNTTTYQTIFQQSVKTGSVHTGSGDIKHDSTSEKQASENAIVEIQKLLQQLEVTNPNATESEKIEYVNIATNPEYRKRAILAFKSHGEKAIEEFISENNCYKICGLIIKIWLSEKDWIQ